MNSNNVITYKIPHAEECVDENSTEECVEFIHIYLVKTAQKILMSGCQI